MDSAPLEHPRRPEQAFGARYEGKPGGWWADAACAGHDPELWFPGPVEGVRYGKAAKRVCAGCPVLDDCRRYALTHAWLTGIWGGLTEAERKKVRRRRNR